MTIQWVLMAPPPLKSPPSIAPPRFTPSPMASSPSSPTPTTRSSPNSSFPTANTSTSNPKTARPSPATFTSLSTSLPAKNIPLSFVLTADRSGPTTPNSANKLGVGGWSYGGISTDFIIAQTTRFKAAISGAGAAEFLSMYGHDQYQKDYETELGLPWENPAAWTKVSPFRNVAKITTPTLFMGGNIDWNVPILGGEQMYQALKRLGVPTELVVYPDEYHEFSVPSHLRDRLER